MYSENINFTMETGYISKDAAGNIAVNDDGSVKCTTEGIN